MQLGEAGQQHGELVGLGLRSVGASQAQFAKFASQCVSLDLF